MDDLHQSLAERRTRRTNRQLPKRYQDIAPEPPAALPPSSLQVTPEYAHAESNAPHSPSHQSPSHTRLVRKVLKSPSNVFGLFRQYYATCFPDHDPEAKVTSDDLSMSLGLPYNLPVKSYAPYPNQSSFLLGEWYWNDGEKKSQSGFQNLLKIVGHPDFRPEDVSGNNWRMIDTQLSGERCLKGPTHKEDEWEDDNGSRLAGWVETPIRINVPFQKRALRPGPKEFDAGILHHRKLMSVIRERITRPSIHPHLHFEPYELFWQPKGATEPVRVHGELYTSEAFIDAHNKLQDSPPEPGCDLPGLCSASCSPLMALNSHLSAPLNFGLFILR